MTLFKTQTLGSMQERLCKWEKEMSSKYEIPYSRATLTSLLLAYHRVMSIQDVERVLNVAKSQGLQPDRNAYNTAISAAASMANVKRHHRSIISLF